MKRKLLSAAILLLATIHAPARSARAMVSAPDFTLQSLSGAPIRLSALRGHAVVLDFWASWCPPCIAQVPAMRRLTEQYKHRGIVVLNINVMDDVTTVQEFIDKHGSFGSDVLLTTNESVMNAYHVEDFPTTVVIDRAGKIRTTVSGGNADDLAIVQGALQRLTGDSAQGHKAP